MHFISKDKSPKVKFATYAGIVCKIRPQKSETSGTRLAVGGNLIKYLHNIRTPTSDISPLKCLLSSIISTHNAKFCGAGIKYFYLNTPTDTFEYMRIKASLIPKEIMKQYQITDKIHNGYIYMEIRKCMYGLPQSGIINHTQLKGHIYPLD